MCKINKQLTICKMLPRHQRLFCSNLQFSIFAQQLDNITHSGTILILFTGPLGLSLDNVRYSVFLYLVFRKYQISIKLFFSASVLTFASNKSLKHLYSLFNSIEKHFCLCTLTKRFQHIHEGYCSSRQDIRQRQRVALLWNVSGIF